MGFGPDYQGCRCLDYVFAAYAVFAVVLAWDFIVPRVKLGQVRRAIALRGKRDQRRKAA